MVTFISICVLGNLRLSQTLGLGLGWQGKGIRPIPKGQWACPWNLHALWHAFNITDFCPTLQDVFFFKPALSKNILYSVLPLSRSLVAARSKAWVYGRSPAGIVGSNPTGGIDVCCECCVLSGRGLCDGLITRPEKYYRLWWVVVCDLETSWMRRSWPALGRSATGKKERKKEVLPLRWLRGLQIVVKVSDIFEFQD